MQQNVRPRTRELARNVYGALRWRGPDAKGCRYAESWVQFRSKRTNETRDLERGRKPPMMPILYCQHQLVADLARVYLDSMKRCGRFARQQEKQMATDMGECKIERRKVRDGGRW